MAPTQVKSSPARKADRPAAHNAAYSPKVDQYIASAAPFAQPILMHIRELVHKALPDVEEDIKWSMPFFIYRGLMLGNMAAFKQHCSFGLWGKEAAANLREDGVYDRNGMGVLGKMTSIKDLPSDREFIKYIRAAAAEIETGARTQNYSRPKNATPKPPPEIPPALAAALKKNRAAANEFAIMPPGCQREYCEWISEAKRDETRDKRVATAVEWIAEGKRRNWKYENC
ncbi:MAG TPA: YdeI/OmpD-associated family protein [Bryocella sp.]|nr:YdeI/OmpD-associated family protein [Bryocella sp.]